MRGETFRLLRQSRYDQTALFVFDDVHLSQDMWRAWEVLKRRKGFAYTVDAGRFEYAEDNKKPRLSECRDCVSCAKPLLSWIFTLARAKTPVAVRQIAEQVVRSKEEGETS